MAKMFSVILMVRLKFRLKLFLQINELQQRQMDQIGGIANNMAPERSCMQLLNYHICVVKPTNNEEAAGFEMSL